MSVKSIIYIPFTGLGLYNGFRGQNWFENRAEIFKKYTLQSLANQTDKDFLIWISFRPEEKDNEVTKKIEGYVKATDISYIFTFNGLMFWDDKDLERNKTWKERLTEALKNFSIKEDYVYLTLLGSDDMFSEDIVEYVKKQEYKNGKALYMKNGYVYNSKTKELADWNNPFSVANYTLMYERDEFLDAERHIMKQSNLTTHEMIPQIYLAEEIEGRRYCCVIHGLNISTIWDHPYKRKQYFYEKDKEKILEKFGIVTKKKQ